MMTTLDCDWPFPVSQFHPPDGNNHIHRNSLAKYPGICEAAKALGVHRIHLYLVLSGKRQSHRLKRRYQELKREGAK